MYAGGHEVKRRDTKLKRIDATAICHYTRWYTVSRTMSGLLRLGDNVSNQWR
jgi:hypothetical protein